MAQASTSLVSRILHSPVWRQNQVLIAITCFYVLAVFAVSRLFGMEAYFHPTFYWEKVVQVGFWSGVIFLIGAFFYTILWVRPENPLSGMVKKAAAALTSVDRMLAVLIALVAIPTVQSVYTSFKSMIPNLVPFYADPALYALDRALHFGADPWTYTWSWLGGAETTFYVNLLYIMWLFVVWVFMFHSIFFQKNSPERMRFLVAFSLAWLVVGSFGALMLSSAGPVYFHRVTGLPGTYDALMAKLWDTDVYLKATGKFQKIWALRIQERLWDNYINQYQQIGSGISAMPSVHLATTAMMTFHSYHLNKLVWVVMVAFLVIIQVGSVHLGWHYAIDGYVSIAAAYGLWVLAKKWTAPLYGPGKA